VRLRVPSGASRTVPALPEAMMSPKSRSLTLKKDSGRSTIASACACVVDCGDVVWACAAGPIAGAVSRAHAAKPRSMARGSMMCLVLTHPPLAVRSQNMLTAYGKEKLAAEALSHPHRRGYGRRHE